MTGHKDKYDGLPAGLPKPRLRRKKAKTSKTRRASTPNSKTAKPKSTAKKARKKVTRAKSKPAAVVPKRASEPALTELLDRRRGGKRTPTRSEQHPLLEHPPFPYDRSSLFTQERQATVLCLIQDGAAQAYAAHIAGIGRRTLQSWLRKGRERRDAVEAWQTRIEQGETRADLTEELGHLPEMNDYALFAQLYERAEAESIVDVAQCILDRALARDGFVLGGTEVRVEETEGKNGRKTTVRTSTTVRNGTIECAMWWLQRRDNRMFGSGAMRPQPDDERDDLGRRTDPVGELFEHVCRFFDKAPTEED